MEDNKNIRYLVRIMNTDLDGNKHSSHALTKIKGVSPMFSNAVCRIAGIEKTKKIGSLSESETKKVEEIIKAPIKYGIPAWMFNRRYNPETGDDMHILSADLDFVKSNDIKAKKKIKSYEGMRHAFNLPVRGQKTKNNFRRSKSKGKGGSLGVARKKGKK